MYNFINFLIQWFQFVYVYTKALNHIDYWTFFFFFILATNEDPSLTLLAAAFYEFLPSNLVCWGHGNSQESGGELEVE